MFRTLSLATAFFGAGCATAPADVQAEGSLPVEGRWAIEIGEVYESTCPALEESVALRPEIDRLWVASSREGFMLSMNAGEFGWCNLHGEDFECRPTTEFAWDNPEQRLTSKLYTSGTVIDGTTMEGQFELEFTCHGKECETLGLSETPCVLSGEFSAFSDVE